MAEQGFGLVDFTLREVEQGLGFLGEAVIGVFGDCERLQAGGDAYVGGNAEFVLGPEEAGEVAEQGIG